jgi:hypothetical protein
MEAILNFLRALDSFGIAYNFRYRDKNKYKTAIGGSFCILFLILVGVLGILTFIPFVNRKNYTIVYYTMNLAETEEVNIFESGSNFAVGLSCEAKKGETRNILDLLNLKTSYVLFQKFLNGSYAKFNKPLITHKCTYDDFYNKYDGEFDYLGLSKYECISSKNFTIQGIYSNEIFSYFEFSVQAKNQSDQLLDTIESFLENNDCKVNFAYTDIIIDLDKYRSPITQYLNQIFIQLTPHLYIKRNIYFMNQYFTTDDNLMYIYGDLTPEIMPLYSRYEEYSLYQGLNRKTNRLPNFDYFSKVYLRADLKKTIIKRKYQRLMEFYSSCHCLLNAIYKILGILLNYINNFYGFHALSKFIFFFKELDDENNFNINKKSNMIKEVLSIINSKGNILDNKKSKKKDMEKQDILSINKREEEDLEDIKDIQEVNLYNNNKKKVQNKNSRNSPIKTMTFLTKETLEKEDNTKNDNNADENNNNYYQGKTQKYKLDQKRRKNNIRIRFNFRNNNENNLYSSEKMGTNNDKDSIGSNNTRKVDDNGQIKNTYNIFELFITQFFGCCLLNNLNIKNNAINKAKKILFKKLDVIKYIRNMILFERINQTNINDNEKILMNFFSRPIISVYTKEEKNEFEQFYENYEDKDFDNYYEQIIELANKSKKEEKDIKLLSISNEHLNAFN